MSHIMYSINLSVDLDLTIDETREKVEEALNIACTYLENNTRHDYIAYNIFSVTDLD